MTAIDIKVWEKDTRTVKQCQCKIDECYQACMSLTAVNEQAGKGPYGTWQVGCSKHPLLVRPAVKH